jgi:hypothetical protein
MRTRLDLLVLCALGVYRLWRLVARDTITERWREQLYNRWPPDARRASGLMTWEPSIRQMVFKARPGVTGVSTRPGNPHGPKVSLVAAGLDCPWCAGAWLSAVVTVLADASFGLTWPLVWFAALSTLVGLLGRAEAK